jgi:glucosamine 6-phosphate synthetase-like amidotransferase/phosphosugar isomerase protein
MCGIVAGFNNDKTPVNRWIINQFEDQHSRGMQGFGALFIDEEKKVSVERATEPAKIIVDLQEKINPCSMIVMHHRFPTSTENYVDQTHPMLIESDELKYNYYVVHNGVISNDKEIKKEHEEKYKYQYYTEYESYTTYTKFNDSESLAFEVALFIEKKSKKIGTLGSAAFVAVQVSKKTGKTKKVFFGRNTSPLNLSATNKKIRISSEGEGEAIKPEMLYSFTPGETKFEKRKMPFAEREYVPIGYDVKGTTVLDRLKTDSKWDSEVDYRIAMEGYKTYDKAEDSPPEDKIDEASDELYEAINQEVEYLIESWKRDGIGDTETTANAIKILLDDAKEVIMQEVLTQEVSKESYIGLGV